MLKLHPTPDTAATVRPAGRYGHDDLKAFDLPGGGQLVLPHHLAVTLYWALHDYIHRTGEKAREASKAEIAVRKAANDQLALQYLARYRELFATRNEETSAARRMGTIRTLSREAGRPYGEIEALLRLANHLTKASTGSRTRAARQRLTSSDPQQVD